MAEYELVPDARHIVPLPQGLNPVDAAPLTDAGLTPYHAIRRSWHRLAPGSAAVVIGSAGWGTWPCGSSRPPRPSRVIAVDAKAEALQLAKEYGPT